LSNLLDNANKYSPEDPTIHVEVATEKDGVRFTVQDKGIGMSRDAQKRVFEKFYRVPTGNVHDVKGFGLGLSYVHTMVHAHGGQVQVRSEPGLGSTFSVWLPSQHNTNTHA
ncbi:MAG: sensor histidine kinase, partial [Bacteroidota bacterium]